MGKTSIKVEPLRVVERNLIDHISNLQLDLRASLQRSDLRLDADLSVLPVVAGLSGPACELVQRNRGPDGQVTPFLLLSSGLWAWLGYYEEWAFDRMVGGARSFSFRTASISVHFGWLQDVVKPQIFRAEWAGYAEWTRSNYSFQAKNAGHPHWQFDVMESLITENQERDAGDILELLRQDEGDTSAGVPKDFEPSREPEIILDIVRAQKLSKLHLASAAAWWKTTPLDQHAHAPGKIQDVRTWTLKTIAYLKEELQRL